ncbi:MAG TPA: hypothetical protein PKC54_11975 [Ferruginibacter sp.]|nr:hypothetical protein [Ferruginibacter sp.]
MNRPFLLSIIILFFILATGCNKKTNPSVSNASSNEKPAETKTVKRAVVKTAVPKVIVVNDSVAKRAVDGRYYYDLEGRRYWRNNRDGKYYLYYRGIFENEDFKAPVRQ